LPRTGGRAPNAAAPRALAPQRRADAGRVHGMLWRRRTVWLPTLWGALLMLALAAAAAMALGLVAYDLLAPSAPARGRDGGGARTLVVEGFMSPAELDQVIVTLRVARYERVLTTGGPIEQWPGFDQNVANEVFTATKGAGAQVIKQKGGAGFAVGHFTTPCAAGMKARQRSASSRNSPR